MTPDDLAAALARLGLDAEPPSVGALTRIHRAQVERVPYETVWIHMGERWSIDPVEALRRVAHRSRGGYCFHLNGALALLLDGLGYRVTRHAGCVHDNAPDFDFVPNHLVLVVHDLPTEANPDGRWYVDAGLGDVLHEPLPLRTGVYDQAPLRVGLARDGGGQWHLANDPTGSFAAMTFGERVVGMGEFADRHHFLSTSPESSFARTVTAQLRGADGIHVLRGCELSHRTAKQTTVETLDRRCDWYAALGDWFRIRPEAAAPALDALWARVATAHENWQQQRA